MTRRRLPDPSLIGVLAVIAVMVALSAGLLVALNDDRAPVAEQPFVTWWLLLPLFALAEIFVVHLPTARGAQTHSLREVPNVLGLAFLSPVAYLGAHLVGTGMALVLHRRQRGSKLAFNLALFALEVLAGVTTYRLLIGDASPAEPRGWAVAVGAAVATDLISAVMITVVIAVTERELDRSIITQSVSRGVVVAGANTCLASLVVVLVTFEAVALPLLLVVLLALYLTYRSYVGLWVRHSQVRQLYAMVQETGSLVTSTELVPAVLGQARAIMRASTAELVLVTADGEPVSRRSVSVDSDQLAEFDGSAAGDWWVGALQGHVVHTPELGCALHKPSCRGGIAAPLRSADGAAIGVLLVHDRTVDVDPFTAEDADVFSTVAAHASVALDNARLVDELRQDAIEREHQALHDSLTGLPNRLSLTQRMAEAVDNGTAAVLLVDVDDVERVNEVLGHSAGEALLRLVAQRLREVAGSLVCRLDGSEFAVVLAGRAAADARDFADKMLVALRQPLLLGDVPLHVTGRVGVACAPLDGSEPAALVRHALAALHAAPPGGVTFAHQADRLVRDGERRLTLAADLSHALERGGLEVWYQPQVDARSSHLHGVEALLRWRHPAHGWVPPSEVVDVAERTGQLAALTDFVLTTALADRASWGLSGHQPRVSLNMAAQSLSDENLPDRITRRLWESHTAPGALVIEVTESGVMTDVTQSLRVLHELAALGVEVSIDDFGTGHSSLAYLEQLPVREVKIDRSFVRPLDRGHSDSPVLRWTVALAHEIDLRVIAEGVETKPAASFLADLGCDILQGYLIARPMPAPVLQSWLAGRGTPALEGRQVP